jgi:hypothetical protein
LYYEKNTINTRIACKFYYIHKNSLQKNWVTDLGNFYTPEEEVYLNKTISDYEKLTSIEIAVVTIESVITILNNLHQMNSKDLVSEKRCR